MRLAFRLARRSGRSDVTAMPLGLDTPSTFAVGPLVLVPALKEGLTRFNLDHGQAMVFAWHTGALVLVMIGLVNVALKFKQKFFRIEPGIQHQYK